MIKDMIALKPIHKDNKVDLSNAKDFDKSIPKFYSANDIDNNCKLILGLIYDYLLYNHGFTLTNKQLAQILSKHRKTIVKALNRLISNDYIKFSHDRNYNHRFISYLNLKKTGLSNFRVVVAK